MRVIAGTYRSRRLGTLRGMAMRPTSDRTRETLFNILAPDVNDAFFVDLFAGTGAVGIEALSRGAREAVFVERHAAAVKLLRANLESLGIAMVSGKEARFGGAAEILSMEAMAGLERLAERGVKADIVFADPPYAESSAYATLLNWLGDGEFLSDGGLVVLEHSRRLELPLVAGTLEKTRVAGQGDTALSFYQAVKAA